MVKVMLHNAYVLPYKVFGFAKEVITGREMKYAELLQNDSSRYNLPTIIKT